MIKNRTEWTTTPYLVFVYLLEGSANTDDRTKFKSFIVWKVIRYQCNKRIITSNLLIKSFKKIFTLGGSFLEESCSSFFEDNFFFDNLHKSNFYEQTTDHKANFESKFSKFDNQYRGQPHFLLFTKEISAGSSRI